MAEISPKPEDVRSPEPQTSADAQAPQVPQSDHPDPITGAPGSHPVGTGLGGRRRRAAGAFVGAALGGPVGGLVGAVLGAVSGGLTGKGVAESFNPSAEHAYWREHYRHRLTSCPMKSGPVRPGLSVRLGKRVYHWGADLG